MDTDTPTNGADTPANDVDSSEALKKQIAEYESKLQAAEAEVAKFKDAVKERDESKKRAREEAEKRGEHEKVIAELKAELAEKSALLPEYEALKTKHEAMEKAHREKLIAQLPENVRADFEALPNEAIEAALKLVPTVNKVNTDNSKPTNPPTGDGDVTKMTGDEFMQWCVDKAPNQIREATAKRIALHYR